MWGWGEVVFPCHIPGSALSKYSAVFVYASMNIIPLLCPTIWVEIFWLLASSDLLFGHL
jgi:hypothetical protein